MFMLFSANFYSPSPLTFSSSFSSLLHILQLDLLVSLRIETSFTQVGELACGGKWGRSLGWLVTDEWIKINCLVMWFDCLFNDWQFIFSATYRQDVGSTPPTHPKFVFYAPACMSYWFYCFHLNQQLCLPSASTHKSTCNQF